MLGLGGELLPICLLLACPSVSVSPSLPLPLFLFFSPSFLLPSFLLSFLSSSPPLSFFPLCLLPSLPSFFLYSSGFIYSSVLPKLILDSVKNPKSVSVLGYSELLMRFAARNSDLVSQLEVRAWHRES